MASGPITTWQTEGEKVETVTEFLILGSKITADGESSYEIRRQLLLGRKVMTNLDSVLRNRDITLPTKACIVKAMVFPVVMYRCENWTMKFSSVQLLSHVRLTLCHPVDYSMPGFPVHHQLLEFTQTHVH